ncbi:TonB-dependent receptor [Hyphomonas sp. WL0036]|uniref:TonB-dependent receptor domain-containing protein n=1 Tax=Hyphomonas sediminis TaxID=2866160 RepID=UPI001C7F09AF|nr:TonB-dependent receptor [Hyphomonas sediminis]MBY9067504.1 TonB-dependent receptor [Hyphomonas sediminis]
MKTFIARRAMLGSAAIAALISGQNAFAEEAAAGADSAATESTEAEEQMRMSEIVVTAAGFEQKLVDAPASISVVPAAELKERPYMTLIDVVRDLEGVDVGETADKTGQRTISMRGMGSDYTLVLINGKRQNNHGDIYPNSFSGNQFNHIPPLDTIERVEVIRGPASTLYGSDALGGVINIITKKTQDRWTGSGTVSRSIQADSQFGDDTTIDLSISGPIIANKLNFSGRGSWYDREASNPEYAAVTDPAGQAHYRSLGFGGGGKTVDNTNISYGFTFDWLISENQNLSFDFDGSKQDYDNSPIYNAQGVASFPLGTVDDFGTMLRVGGSGRIEPRAGYSESQEFTRDSWALTHQGEWDFGNSFVSLAYVATNNNGRTLPFSVAERQNLQVLWNSACVSAGGSVGGNGYCAVTGAGYANVNAWNNQSEADKLAFMESNLSAADYEMLLSNLPRPKRTLESAQYTLDAKLDMPIEYAGNHMVVVGGQVIQGELTDGVFGMEAGVSGEAQEHNMYSLFVEDTYQPVKPFSITAGVRYDNHEVFGDHVSPRLYGVYTFSENLTFKGGVSTGFKTPKTTQLYDGVVGFGGQGTSPQFGNPDLKPETSTSTELAIYWQHPRGHNFNATIFRNEFEDKIASQPCGGVLVLTCSSTGDFADLGYSTSTKTVNIDEVLIEGAEIAGRYEVFDFLSVRANYTYTDSEQKSGAAVGLPLTNTAKHMANATLDWQVTGKLSSQLSAESRSKRYRGVDSNTGEQLYYKDYVVYNLGAQYRVTDRVTISGRVNNLLDEDFTSYQYSFIDNGDGSYTLSTTDDYNNKDKARSFWLSVNVRF